MPVAEECEFDVVHAVAAATKAAAANTEPGRHGMPLARTNRIQGIDYYPFMLPKANLKK